ncbi:MAG TPA: hypothetical protein GYA07_13425 [Verrucomicrobia bacterium]|nr:hypothetical protein [Verrucomicrobiota bacterium]HOP97657.1 hypothetical protein [Verrucomicrobiota bacterium]HPU55044.1 hypothetical protein [Verrucomicrobiota bacterium]
MRKTRSANRSGISVPRIVAFALMALGALCAVSGIALLVAPSRFEATATLTVKPAYRTDRTLDTEIELLRSEKILKPAIEQLHASAERTPAETTPPVGPQDIAELRKRLNITFSRDSLDIRVTDRDPQTAATTANAIVAAYSAYLTGVTVSLREQEVKTLRARVEEGRKQMQAANELLLDVGRNLGLSNASPEEVEMSHPTYMEAVREYRRLEESVTALEHTLKTKEDALLKPTDDPLLTKEEATPESRPAGPNRMFGATALGLGVVLLLSGGAVTARARRRTASDRL